uniref:DNA ligase n=1 Tax=Angiostrongylus cantonensis TaxID=6313 RepID=A0A158PA23_ANGCA
MSTSTTRFAADYAKRVAGCKKCKLQLPKGEMRLAKIIPNPFVQNTEGPPPDMKQYYHPHCLFEMFFKARASTKVVENTDDIEGFGDLRDEDKEVILKFIDELGELRAQKEGGTRKTPKKMGDTSPAKETSEGSRDQGAKEKHSSRKKNTEKIALEKEASGAAKQSAEANEDSKYNSFNKCINQTAIIDDYDGDMLTIIRLLLPGVDQRVYNIKEKQIINHFATVDRWLTKLAELTKDDEQIAHLKFAAKRLSPAEIQYLLRLVMKDLRINAGVKHILEGLHSSAYEAFQNCRDLAEIVERQVCKKDQLANVPSVVEVSIRLGTPVLPMLAEPCKSVEQAMKKCINGMFAEIKYDGERVQVHKAGSSYSYYSRSLKPVQHHKISHLENVIPKAFPKASELIIDAEILLVDNATGKPLPFGTLGVHKKEKFKDASVCLFVSISERKKLLESQMMEVKNRVMMSNYQLIRNGDNGTLKTMIWKAIDEGLEGLVLKDTKSIYEPGKRHWLKVKKDYLEDGRMADTADLLVLGAYFGTGNKGSLYSCLLTNKE